MRIPSNISALADRLGYRKFTPLQQKVFEEPAALNHDQWLFISGSTSSGKTLIPLLLFLHYREEHSDARMLFCVPYRALASQKREELEGLAFQLGLQLHICYSTGEYRVHDADIRSGIADIAIIIYEKAFIFSCESSTFLSQYDFCVFDEIGLVKNSARGKKIDHLLIQSRKTDDLRVIALGTPFYRWGAYIHEFDFLLIQEKERPVRLNYAAITYKKAGKHHVEVTGIKLHSSDEPLPLREGKSTAIHTGVYDNTAAQERCKKEFSMGDIVDNPAQTTDVLVEQLVEFHARKGHRILIFSNNRVEVRKLAQRLYLAMKARGLCAPGQQLNNWTSPAYCQKKVADILNISTATLSGVLDQKDLNALSGRIAYHNADLPPNFRQFVENELLKPSGRLRVACSTETLAFGINSNVDVVIIPNPMKFDEETETFRFLDLNEFMNYAGRSGRMNRKETAIQPGYVYTLLPEGLNEWKYQRLFSWLKNPPILISRYYQDVSPSDDRPFFLLSLFPHTDEKGLPVTADQLSQSLQLLPSGKDSGVSGYRPFDKDIDLMQPLNYLVKKKLVSYQEYDDASGEEDVYCLTDIGRKMCGYVIRTGDLDHLEQNLAHCFVPESQRYYRFDLFMMILQMQSLRPMMVKLGRIPGIRENQNMTKIRDILTKSQRVISPFWQARLTTSGLANFVRTEENHGITVPPMTDEEKGLAILCSIMLYWSWTDFSMNSFQYNFRFSYQQMQRLAEQLSYYLHMIALLLPLMRLDGVHRLSSSVSSADSQRLSYMIDLLNADGDTLFYRVSGRLTQLLGTKMRILCPEQADQQRALVPLYDQLSDLMNTCKRNNSLTPAERRQATELLREISRTCEQQSFSSEDTEYIRSCFEKRFGGLTT